MKPLTAILVVALVLAIAVPIKIYQWNDCRMVGHSWFYCVMRMGE